MEKKLCEQFLPFNYTQSLYKDLHNLKQEGSVEVFHQLVIRVELNESEEQIVHPRVLSPQSLWNVSEAFNWALLVEKQQTRPALRYGQWGMGGGFPTNIRLGIQVQMEKEKHLGLDSNQQVLNLLLQPQNNPK